MRRLLHWTALMPRRFGTAGIRGVTNRDITPELALRLGTVVGDWVAARKKSRPNVAVAHDTRYGAELLARAAASGLAGAGADVQFFGCVPTGVLALNLVLDGLDAGILVTGSHLPPDRTGLILVRPDGSYCPVAETDEVEARLDAWPARDRVVRPEDLGRIDEVFHPYEHYVAEYVKRADARALRDRKFRVVIDPANGPASYVAMELFQWFGCEVEMLNFDPSPIPGRPSEPRAHTVGGAREAVLKHRADFGLCLDVDADRALFIDAEGRPVVEDVVGAILARGELKPGDTWVTPVTSSGLLERAARDLGARLEYCEVGLPATCEAIRRLGAAYACEESGKYYFPRRGVWSDGLFTGLRMLETMLREGKPLAELAAAQPAFHPRKRSIPLDEPRRSDALERLSRVLSTELTAGRLRDVTLDGFKRIYDDDSWLLLRASGTEPVLRIFADAPDAARADALAAEGERLVLDVVRRMGP